MWCNWRKCTVVFWKGNVCRWLLQTDKDHHDHAKHVGYRAMFEAVVSTGESVMCVYVCRYVCMCIHMYMYSYLYMYISIYMLYLCVYVYLCVSIHIHINSHPFNFYNTYRRLQFRTLQTKDQTQEKLWLLGRLHRQCLKWLPVNRYEWYSWYHWYHPCRWTSFITEKESCKIPWRS